MKRKFYYAASAVVLLVVSAVNIYASEEAENQMPDIVMANIEALTDGEGGASGNIVDCYSSSEGKKGATYYDCGTCTKQTNAKGTGNSRTCVVK